MKKYLSFIVFAIMAVFGLALVSCGGDDDDIIRQHTGHEYVDLGLSTKWATCNIGANSPEEYGDYFAWGETEGYLSGKTLFNWSSYMYCNGSYNSLTKYCDKSHQGTVDNKTILELGDDAANVNWGGNWRMPTREELDELRQKCTWTWTIQNGVNGYKVTSKKNGSFIFLPDASQRINSGLTVGNSHYWSSSLSKSSSNNYAICLSFDSSDIEFTGNYRSTGNSVRAVCP